ncbi:SAM-dependent methyltransferase [Rugosimonospora acidiphila]|uniref:SAM-dependent methyltransferase n=1 Tax=Rugosimonospora acidiphila TaxID=556531 RepID=UPI0031EB88C4
MAGHRPVPRPRLGHSDGGQCARGGPPPRIARFFSGYELVDPGVTLLPQWHPDRPVSEREAREANLYGGVGVLRG